MPEVTTQVDKDDPLELSGRNLDAAVAERIMGWANVESGCYTPIGQEWCGDDPEGTGGFNRTGRKIIPRYSERIADAMEVVEKMWQADWQVEMVNGHKLNTLITDNVQIWYVRFINNENDMDNWSAEAATLPEAICRTALAALENK